MNNNDRFFSAFDLLKKKGLINTYVELAEILNTNKTGINDLKTGKKKVSVDNIKSMIISYPILSLRWLVLGEGEIERKKTDVDSIEINVYNELIMMQKKEITRLEKEIAQLKNNPQPNKTSNTE